MTLKGHFISEVYNGDYGAYRKARNTDYCKVQLEWSCFIDSLCKCGEITQCEYDNATF
ncbi:MAG: hypothetical protein RR588_03435 [Solibacillus sp.]